MVAPNWPASAKGHGRAILTVTRGFTVNGYGRGVGLALASLAIAAAASLVLSGCSELASPPVHDVPAPRADTTLTPDQIQQATDDLTNQRDHLNSEANGQVPPVNLGPYNGSSQSQRAAQPARGATAPPTAAQNGTSDGTMTAGAYAKP